MPRAVAVFASMILLLCASHAFASEFTYSTEAKCADLNSVSEKTSEGDFHSAAQLSYWTGFLVGVTLGKVNQTAPPTNKLSNVVISFLTKYCKSDPEVSLNTAIHAAASVFIDRYSK